MLIQTERSSVSATLLENKQDISDGCMLFLGRAIFFSALSVVYSMHASCTATHTSGSITLRSHHTTQSERTTNTFERCTSLFCCWDRSWLSGDESSRSTMATNPNAFRVLPVFFSALSFLRLYTHECLGHTPLTSHDADREGDKNY